MKLKILLIICYLPVISCSAGKLKSTNEVKVGASQLERYLPLIEGKRIAIVANDVSRIDGVHLIDTLLALKAKNNAKIDIRTIFSPEHGFSLKFEAGRTVKNEEYSLESIKMISLYGKKKKPDKSDLTNIDIVIFDLQDVGVRFYTYISTLHYVMEACAENNVPLIVLDRPNPHCYYIDGPILDVKYKSFVGMHAVPVVYGMTIGEYALMINGENWLQDLIRCELTVIKMENFSRNTKYNFPLKPSPNLPNMSSILLYPSLCLFEGTVMSIGRGTEFPFEVYGHPDYPETGFQFMPKSMPGASSEPKHENLICNGVSLQTLNLDSLHANLSLNLSYLIASYQTMDLGEDFFSNYFDLLAGTSQLRKDIIEGKSADEIYHAWDKELNEFQIVRGKYLIYK